MASAPQVPNERRSWPWRPREGYPSVPGWLFTVVVIVVVLVGLVLIAMFANGPEGR